MVCWCVTADSTFLLSFCLSFDTDRRTPVLVPLVNLVPDSLPLRLTLRLWAARFELSPLKVRAPIAKGLPRELNVLAYVVLLLLISVATASAKRSMLLFKVLAGKLKTPDPA